MIVFRETKDYETITRLNETIHNLHVELYPDLFQTYNYKALLDFFAEKMDLPGHTFLIALEDEVPAGYAWIEFKELPPNIVRKMQRLLYVHHLSVEEAFRGKGCGSGLMNAICEIAKVNHIPKIELDYWTSNETAKAFYMKRGFQVCREFASIEL